MIRLLLSLCIALALAPSPMLAADAAVEYPSDNGGFPPPPDGVPIGEEGVEGGFVQYAAGKSHLPAQGGAISRIKDIAQLQSARDNQLVGYGLVIGLQGSGDSLRNSPFTEQSIRAMLENLGIASEGGRSAPRTSRPSSSPPICRPSSGRARASTSPYRRSATRPRSPAAR